MKTAQSEQGALKRILGLRSLFAIAVGVVVAQVVFISILQGVGLGGSDFFVALLVAFVLTLCYVFTFSELALMLPKAGSISAYTEVAVGHMPAIVATIAGYLAPAIFGLPAELFLLEAVLDSLFPGSFTQIGWLIILVLMFLNILGVDFFAKVQNLFAYLMIVSLLVIGIAGLSQSEPQGGSVMSILEGLKDLDIGVLSLTMLALWSFFGLEFVCPMIEETKNPSRNIPRSMILAAVVLLVVYALVALAGYLTVPQTALSESEIPHAVLVTALFGESGKMILAVLAVTATCSTINTVLATIPRMLYGMGRNQQLPTLFTRLHPKTNTPWLAIVFVASLIMIPTILLGGQDDIILTLVISAATIWLVAYVISHINLIVLRKRYPDYKRPFKSPWYPFPQILGIIGMVYMILNNSPSPEMTLQVYMNAGLMVLIATIYAAIWVKFKMKKDWFEPEPIEKALKS
ncbi:APC family permease [Croceitalea rosinachiae]|uniref:APC family permease n=1 Tax=Croceitalea rosinachiae TaxID=3075596 RepID=A0ABU3AEJ9_9FLAO|nr:APC family permease [Croceitalea sp. F388]MDT0608325.1 APC family permease [Croceitalea sp. F388]